MDQKNAGEIRYATITTQAGFVTFCETGEDIPLLKGNYTNVTTAKALNALGERGYDVFLTSSEGKKTSYGEFTYITFYLKASPR